MGGEKHFDNKTAYAEQEEVYFDDGRETELIRGILCGSDCEKMRGSPRKVLAAIDAFGRQKYLMNIGQEKGAIVTKLIATHKPKVMVRIPFTPCAVPGVVSCLPASTVPSSNFMISINAKKTRQPVIQVELGGYVGYSAILFADAVRAAGGKHFYCLEHNPEFFSIIRMLCELAGLGDFVTVIYGDSAECLRQLKSQGLFTQIDLLFLDHYKPLYLRDLKLCEELGFINPGTTLVADNVIKPGNPPYLAYVRATPEEKKKMAASADESRSAGGGGSAENETSVEEDPKGNPSLIYESSLVESFEPTGIPDGVEISRCVGLLSDDTS
ncbi:probable catechol O-methyltransferase [Claviceps purpurea 20.1]|uniref:catechol O-methyltransferase n=1 Tax=Claviceps purpurea (strain 20.1) TaxID=1111077 RepID=M1W886_CLAP2|nr:probable catechol O-methyltransferase [Claviceps purpurea 20.1]